MGLKMDTSVKAEAVRPRSKPPLRRRPFMRTAVSTAAALAVVVVARRLGLSLSDLGAIFAIMPW